MKSVDAQIRLLEGKLSSIKSIEVPSASSSALNKVSGRIKSRVVKGVSKETKIKAKVIRKRVYISRSTVKKQRAKLNVYTREVAAISLVKNAKNGAFKRKVAGKKISNAWVADGSKGYGRYKKGAGYGKTKLTKQQILKRSGKSRYPVEVVTISILKPVTRITKTVSARIIKNDFAALYANDLNYRLGKYAI
jgi:hypothetical protein